MEYHWWGISECVLDATLYNILAPSSLSHPVYEHWNEFVEKDPHLAYAWLVGGRFRPLDDLIVSLRVVVQMIGVSVFPIKSEVMDINRYDWFISILDLGLLRLSAVRDCCAFLVREVFELDLTDHNTNLKTLLSHLGARHPVIVHLRGIGGVGTNLRAERNRRAHQGMYRNLGEDSNQFKFAAHIEAHGSQMQGYDVQSEYSDLINELYSEYVADVETLIAEVDPFQELLAEEFLTRFDAKRCRRK